MKKEKYMNKKLSIAILTLILVAFITPQAQAAFPVKTELVSTSHNNLELASGNTIDASLSSQTQALNDISPRHTLGSSNIIPQGLYIVLSFLALGWLALGVNDDWLGNDWLISLILYILGWLPGFVYSIIKMGKYYN